MRNRRQIFQQACGNHSPHLCEARNAELGNRGGHSATTFAGVGSTREENNCVPPEWRDVQIGFWVRVCARGAVEKNQAGQLRARIKQVQSISGQR